MQSKTLFVLLLGLTTIVCSANRTAIINNYKKQLDNYKNIFNNTLAEVQAGHEILDTHLKNHLSEHFQQVMVQINITREAILRTKTESSNDRCFKCLLNEVSSLSPNVLNECLALHTIDKSTKKDLLKLGQVAHEAVMYCDKLNPLDTQHAEFEKCLHKTASDLESQVDEFNNKFQEESVLFLKSVLECINTIVTDIYVKTGIISYKGDLCALVQ